MSAFAQMRGVKQCASRLAIALSTFSILSVPPVQTKEVGTEGAHAAPLEEIYVLRSIRDKQPERTARCAASEIGFSPYPMDADRRFSFWSIASRPRDGLVIDTASEKVAELHGCFGATEDKTRQNFYAEIYMGPKLFRGRGECQALLVNFPEDGLVAVRCQIVLNDVSAPYVGGLLTTNTLTSSAQYGGKTSPPGYTQASVATIRLWKHR